MNTVATQANQREIRHLKMFYILISLMAAFIVLRLPAWIFLIMRMYGDYTQPVDWILHFVFGILTLASCVLNPLLYTFLTETIHYCEFTIEKILLKLTPVVLINSIDMPFILWIALSTLALVDGGTYFCFGTPGTDFFLEDILPFQH
uniref:G-protein coupled receptors family 1 profile domain-containing protein n=1 Tax=Megaselia scalaris TaxID=36166 RepID=T1GYE8_MEGSC